MLISWTGGHFFERSCGLVLRSTAIVLLIVAAASRANEPAESAAVDFERDVLPIFQAHCLDCHGADAQEGGFRLDLRAEALRGGDNYAPAIHPKQSAESPLYQFISKEDAELRMPPEGDRLSAAEIDTLRRWIDAGAAWPATEEESEDETQHWSFQSPQRHPLPEVATPARSENLIDPFIQKRLDDEGLSLSPPADRRTLARRLWIDVIGLPPNEEEVAGYVNDDRPDAHERTVDRLLSSPHFGERWARPWLDIVRFAESNGFEMNQPRPNAWPYRDYVIRSFNTDVPYGLFLEQQIAGDTLGADEATGFLVAGPWDQVKSPDPVLTAQQRADELHDIVSTTGSTMLGLTVGCARCHRHKFDPIPQADYYAMKAVFEGVKHGDRPRASVEENQRKRELNEVRRRLAEADLELRHSAPLAQLDGNGPPTRPKVVTGINVDRFAPTVARFVRFTITATSDVEPCIDELEIFSADDTETNVALASAGGMATASGTFPGAAIHKLEHLTDGRYGNDWSWISNESGKGWVQIELARDERIDTVVWSRDRTEPPRYSDRLPTAYAIEVSRDGESWTLVATGGDRLPRAENSKLPTPTFQEKDQALRFENERKVLVGLLSRLSGAPMVYAGRFEKPPVTHRLHRGDPMQPREEIAPGSLTSIGPPIALDASLAESDRRLEFARWIASKKNPLTYRVIANRLWQQHMGEGIVSTPSDFGSAGSTPTHPELLDRLALELVDADESLKHLHRLIVTSATYRQSSDVRPEGKEKDAGNRYLWRFSPRRLDAEMLRDAILATSGNLDLAMGGPGFDLFEPNANYVKVYISKQVFGPAEWRRMVYQSKPRMQLDSTFGAFDCPDGGQIAPKRSRSTTPLQALNLINSGFISQQAAIFAERAKREGSDQARKEIARVFELALGREPSEEEAAAAGQVVAQGGLPLLCRALFNANEFVMLF